MVDASPYRHEVLVNDLPRSEMGWKKRSVRRIKGICVHRCSVAECPEDVARWFLKNGGWDKRGWPGHPYHFQINIEDGLPVIYQTALLNDYTAGVFGYNSRGVHVMVHGDFRREAPSPILLQAVSCLCADLRGFGVGASTMGHSERSLSLAKRYWTSKICPGREFDLETMRRHISRILRGDENGLSVLPVGEAWWRAR